MKNKTKENVGVSSEANLHPSSFILHPSDEVVMFCDGSSLGNGQALSRAAAVAILSYRDKLRAVGDYLGAATNQQAEIVAAALGLETLRRPCRVKVFTDSRYVVETMAGRFRRKSNHELWARLDRARQTHDVQWQWTKGHAGQVVQEACDKAARTIAALGRVDESVLREAEAVSSKQKAVGSER